MATRNTTQGAPLIGNAYESGYRARQGALRAEQEHMERTGRAHSSTTSQPIPLSQGILTIIIGILLWSFFYQRSPNQNPHLPARPTYHDPQAIKQRNIDLENVRNGTYQGNGIVPVPEYIRREQRRLGLRD